MYAFCISCRMRKLIMKISIKIFLSDYYYFKELFSYIQYRVLSRKSGIRELKREKNVIRGH